VVLVDETIGILTFMALLVKVSKILLTRTNVTEWFEKSNTTLVYLHATLMHGNLFSSQDLLLRIQVIRAHGP